MARFNQTHLPRPRGCETAARIASLGKNDVRCVMDDQGVGERRACAEIERKRGLRWQQVGQVHVCGTHS